MTMQKRPILRLAKTDIDYRVAWNEGASHWDITRNGVDIDASRRKKQSAIALAIQKAQAEINTSPGRAVVTTVEDRKVKTEWTGSHDETKKTP